VKVDADFLIVGGGPAGATAGGLLAQAGHPVVICEHKKFPRHKVCGEFISAQARPVLERLGLLERFDSLAGPEIRRFAAYPAEGPMLSAAMPAAGGKYPRSLSRDVLDEMLLERAVTLGAQVLQPCHVTEIQGNAAEGFGVSTSTNGPIKARCVVLAHGLAQRGAMDGHDIATPSGGYMCFKCHMEGCDTSDETIAIGGVRGLYAGLVRTSDNGDGRGNCVAPPFQAVNGSLRGSPEPHGDVHSSRYTLAFVVNVDQIAKLGGGADAHLQHLLMNNRGFRTALANAKRIGPWYASGPMAPGVRRIYHDGRFFVGNAAGEVHALVGEGMTLAMRGAMRLAESIAAVDPSLGNLDGIGRAYEHAWNREFRGRYRAANVFAHLMVRPTLATLAAGLLDAFPALLDYCVVRSGKWS
jgi:menaquinone-9 beta-reductase